MEFLDKANNSLQTFTITVLILVLVIVVIGTIGVGLYKSKRK